MLQATKPWLCVTGVYELHASQHYSGGSARTSSDPVQRKYLAGVRFLQFCLHGSAGESQELGDIGRHIVPVVEAQYGVGVGSAS